MIKLKDLVREDMPLNDEEIEMYKAGYLQGRKDVSQKYERDLENLPLVFVSGYKKGYRTEYRKRLWNNINSGMTDFLTRMGSSLKR